MVVVGNYTYLAGNNQQCINGKLGAKIISTCSNLSHITIYGTWHFQYNTGGYLNPVDLPNLVDRLKFVSCGERGFTNLAFGEFVHVFDRNVWIMLLISLIVVAFSLYGIISGGLDLFLSTLLILGKILVEQGNPFTKRFMSNQKLKIIIILYLLGSMIFSNGYKNSNIYKMIKSREILDYETFSELINANFNIYV